MVKPHAVTMDFMMVMAIAERFARAIKSASLAYMITRREAVVSEKVELLGCPHCGLQPRIVTTGTGIDIYCCTLMSRYKSAYLTLEECLTWNNDTHAYSDQAERKALVSAANEWNKRKGGGGE